MQVYEKRPSGLGPELMAHARRDRGGASFAVGRALVGVVLIALLGAPLGPLWAILGVGLLGSSFLFVQAAGRAAIRRPALILTGTPKWDGTRRTSWSIEADDPAVAARALADGLDHALGASMMAADEGESFRGVGRREAFESTVPVQIAWGVGRAAKLTATEDVEGVWMRIDPGAGAEAKTVTLLANEGRAREALVDVAWRV